MSYLRRVGDASISLPSIGRPHVAAQLILPHYRNAERYQAIGRLKILLSVDARPRWPRLKYTDWAAANDTAQPRASPTYTLPSSLPPSPRYADAIALLRLNYCYGAPGLFGTPRRPAVLMPT